MSTMSIRKLLSSWLPPRHSKNLKPQSQFQILSDLHLEVCRQYHTFRIAARAPNLVLAGDIGRLVDYDAYLHFLFVQTAAFECVFLVLGNHEFYGLSFDEAINRAKQLEAEPVLGGKLVLLHQRRWDDELSDVTVLGYTLWSHIPPESADLTAAKINDFKQIEGWTVDSHNGRFASDMAWLRGELTNMPAVGNGKRSVLVVTHHAPCMEGTSHPKNSNNPWSVAFATDVFDAREWRDSGIGYWVFGHTHYTTEMVKEGVRIVSNQRGYVFPGANQEVVSRRKPKMKLGLHDFDVGKVIDL